MDRLTAAKLAAAVERGRGGLEAYTAAAAALAEGMRGGDGVEAAVGVIEEAMGGSIA